MSTKGNAGMAMNLFSDRNRKKNANVIRMQQTQAAQQEDILLKKIDDLRDKAQDIKDRIGEKEKQLEQLNEEAIRKKESVSEVERVLEEQLTDIAAHAKGLSEDDKDKLDGRFDDVEAAIDRMIASLDKLKEDIGEKTHTEGVTVYRNLKSDLDELKEQTLEISTDLKVKPKTSGVAVGALIFGILNCLLIVAYILYDLGIYNYFM